MRLVCLLFLLFALGWGKECTERNEEIRKGVFRESTCNGTDRYRLPRSCLCREGFYRDDNGQCVEWENCCRARQCTAQETYHICGRPCEKTCTDLTAESCNDKCGPAACICTNDLYRDSTGACVSLEECRQCSENEEYKGYGTSCEPKCGDLNIQQRCQPPYASEPGCTCKEGYVRDPKNGNKCLPAAYCTDPMCRENEVYSYGQCENTCRKTATTCDFGWDCRCEPGFLRNAQRKCVPKGQCKGTQPARPFFG